MNRRDLAVLAEFIANQPGTSVRLLREHRDDGTGRCRRCSAGGQGPHYPWPCAMVRAADAAQRIEHRRRRPT
ncbi:hypothetical protein BJF78_26210 [Pseudonocardia sp. CNS-139]|nr:hypothetical protein BJF78_26210 [Pseudonocardia sp. CNS-139]